MVVFAIFISLTNCSYWSVFFSFSFSSSFEVKLKFPTFSGTYTVGTYTVGSGTYTVGACVCAYSGTYSGS